MRPPTAVDILLVKIKFYSETYNIHFQFKGSFNAVFISKGDVDLTDHMGDGVTMGDVMKFAVKYIERVNPTLKKAFEKEYLNAKP